MMLPKDLGEPCSCMQLQRDSATGAIALSRSAMIGELLERERHGGRCAAGPGLVCKLVKALCGEGLDTEQHPCRSLVGSLLHLAVCTRPDAAFVGVIPRHITCRGSARSTAAGWRPRRAHASWA